MTSPIAAAPVSYGVFEMTVGRPGLPDGPALIEAMADAGYAGSELGPPGYLGRGREVGELLAAYDMQLAGSFLPLRFSRDEGFAEDMRELESALGLLSEAAEGRDQPVVLLSDASCEPDRLRYAGAIEAHPEAWLGERRQQAAVRQRPPRGRALSRARLRDVVPPARGQLHRDAARGRRAARADGHEPARPLLRHGPLGLRRRRSAGAPAPRARARQPRAFQGRRPRVAGPVEAGGQGARGDLGGRRVLSSSAPAARRSTSASSNSSRRATTAGSSSSRIACSRPASPSSVALEAAEHNRAWLRERGQ